MTDGALRRFADRHGFDPGLLLGDDRYAVTGAGADFDGRVAAIRLLEHGRFGNVFHQILHAAMLARLLGVGTVRLFAYQGGPPPGRHLAGGLEFIVGDAGPDAVPTLVGHFFNSYAFQSALTGYLAALPVQIVDEVMRPLFAHLRPDGPGDGGAVVLNFRGGDVFADRVPPWYVQPPAGYYIRAALFARQAFGCDRAVLVAEDARNPAIPIVAARLAEAGLAVQRRGGDFAADVAVLVGAVHLVSPFGTMCEALAMLSPVLRSYTAFRQFESHRHLHMRRPGLLLQVLLARGVQPVRLVDRGLSYIPPLGWTGAPAQRDLMTSFPAARLQLDLIDDAADDACFTAFPTSGVAPAAAEAFALRARLSDLRQAGDNAARDAAAARAAAALAERQANEAQMELQAAQAQVQAARQDAVAARAEAWRARSDAASLRGSTSWRATAPLRAVRRALEPPRAPRPGR